MIMNIFVDICAGTFASWRYSAGAGIRWMSPMGPMRFEYGYNLDARDYESKTKFDFMIGRFF